MLTPERLAELRETILDEEASELLAEVDRLRGELKSARAPIVFSADEIDGMPWEHVLPVGHPRSMYSTPLEGALASIVAEANAWRAEHGESETEDYASGLLSAVHDICEATHLPWPEPR